MVKDKLIVKINTLLPFLNLILFLFVSGLILYLFIFYKLQKQDEVVRVIFVIQDEVFNKLVENKYIQINNLAPLQVKILDNHLYLTKDGVWKAQKEKNIVIIVPENLVSKVLKGVIPYEKK